MQHLVHRPDAVWLHNPRRLYVPTVWGEKSGNTVWVSTWEQFRAVGGVKNFSEDQTEITLTLPEGHKFSIQFQQQPEE